MLILGIETSCDETAAAVVKDRSQVLSNVIASQIDIHKETGGVVPEVAARAHVLEIMPVVEKALREAKVSWEEIDAIAVTKGPGLMSSLLIGTTAASSLGLLAGKPVVPVNHIHGHVMANWLDRDEEAQFPILVFTVSGGHNEIVLMKGFDDMEVIGETLDDAAGEAFDKVARLLRLSYPGGPEIARIAEQGDPESFELPVVTLEKNSLDFSFSGLKTAVLNLVISEKNRIRKEKGLDEGAEIDLSESFVADVAASFQATVAKIFVEKLKRALDQNHGVKEVHLTGGVSANRHLRVEFGRFLAAENGDLEFKFPQNIRYCTDNAAMIAGAGSFMFATNPEKYRDWENCVADPRF